MAATDTTYRNQKILHIVFALSSIVMLLTVVGMFAEDYYRDWKVEQRSFRDVEEELAKRMVLAATPSEQQLVEIVATEKARAEARKNVEDAKKEIEKNHGKLLSKMEKAEIRKRGIKADMDSKASFINMAAEKDPEKGLASDAAQKIKKEFDQLSEKFKEISEEVEELNLQYESAAKVVGLPDHEAKLKKAEAKHKALLADFDRFVKLTTSKRWKSWKEGLLQMPIIDSFNSPTKIQQYTLDELPIDYSFKYVTRYDRCTTCHLGLEKAGFDKESLSALVENPDKTLINRFKVAEKIINTRKGKIDEATLKEMAEKSHLDKETIDRIRKGKVDNQLVEKLRQRDNYDPLHKVDPYHMTLIEYVALGGEKDLPDPKELEPHRVNLSPGRIGQFSSHPRLDLFVDANSPHAAEKFGCTICHGGQGSSTDFYQATHTPTDAITKERWAKDYGWKSNHYWDFPMMPARFTESSCLKCHHQVTDLIREGSKTEAPKLVKGYNLVRELGCFGCHEIAGIKAGRKVGPDLRLEPDPALDTLSPLQRVKDTADPMNPPGAFRKVGPSLFRLAEKTSEDWVRPWLKDPRGFRPDTKMPHFYGQANNDPIALAGTGQEKFPDTEIHAIAFYLKEKSSGFVKDMEAYHSLKAKSALTQQEKDTLAALEARQDIRSSTPPITGLKLPTAATNADRGRVLFTEKGCLACHQHTATTTDAAAADGKKTPALAGESTFGPDLSRLAHKLGSPAGKPETARQWLVSWLLNPAGHSPRTLMPNVQLTAEDANDIATWLLSQKPEWKPLEVAVPDTDTLKAMARVYLDKVMTKAEVKRILDNGVSDDRAKQLGADADERELVGAIDDKKLKLYVGKKAIGNQGCYACHSIPGFQNAKPIGTALNEWGKKDADRIAFEDIKAFLDHHFNVVTTRDDPKDPSKPAAEWKPDSKGKPPYEKYFADMLDHHGRKREGFLQMKLVEPRGFDHNRIRTWDDRLRMPQFKFARTKRLPNEKDEQFEARALKEEAEGREAVMTFVLGLVAEAVPPKYVNNPTGDKLAEVKGRQVLDKFNCAGCHIVRPGLIDFKPVDLKIFEGLPDVRKLEVPYKGDEYVQPEHNAWTGVLQSRPDRMRVHGVNPPVKEEDEDPKLQSVWLMKAFRFQVDGKTRDLPAGATMAIPKDTILAQYPQFGGRFTELLSQYLQKKDPENYAGTKVSYAFAAAPPTLVNEGEKSQPDWLYRFLLNPTPIRPLTVLRMPKFNMSEDDAQALVNYFGAVDKTTNPGIGLVTPYVSIPQRDEDYIREQSENYIARLKAEGKYDERKKEFQSFWEKSLTDRVATTAARAKLADDLLKGAKTDPEKDVAKKMKETADAEAKLWKDKADKKDVAELVTQWEKKEAYLADAQRAVAHGNICLTCHQAGGFEPKENKGPNLDQAGERLRPEWTRRWVTNPTRYLHYNSVMPINFKATAKENQDAFVGTSEEQIRAVRDYLMLYPHIKDWPILKARPILGMTPGGTTP